MQTPIIFIGPMNTGKTTIALLLAKQLGMEEVELDDLRWDYYREIGYDEALAKQLAAETGFPALYQYWKPFEIHAVERVLADHPDCIISFGAGHSVYEDETLFARAQRALAPIDHVILILPCPDLNEAAAVLRQRLIEMAQKEGFTPSERVLDMVDHFVKHPSNGLLAKKVFYTHGKTPDQSCDEIIRWLEQ